MGYPVTIEVELRDSGGHQLVNQYSLRKNLSLIDALQSLINEHTGGLLCFDHFGLPKSKTVYSNGRWVVQISCCCSNQMKLLEKRLVEIFNK